MITSTTTDHRSIRAAALAECVTIAEADHARAVRVDGATAPTREAVIVAVLDEANAFWQVENNLIRDPRTLTVDEARETATDMVEAIAERVSGIVAGLHAQR